jgi:hypothetical protein
MPLMGKTVPERPLLNRGSNGFSRRAFIPLVVSDTVARKRRSPAKSTVSLRKP